MADIAEAITTARVAGGRHPPRAVGRGARQAGPLRRRARRSTRWCAARAPARSAGRRRCTASPATPRACSRNTGAPHADDRPVGGPAGAGRGSARRPAAARALHQALSAAGCRAELLVVLAAERRRVAVRPACRLAWSHQHAPATARRCAIGFAAATGAWVLTIDADTVEGAGHRRGAVDAPPRRRRGHRLALRRRRRGADAVPLRRLLSRALNAVFGRGLSLGVRDMSSGMRMYRAPAMRALRELPPHLDVLQAILVAGLRRGLERGRGAGASTRPLPGGQSHARAWRFAADYARTFWRLWKLRNSIECADYDARAHDSVIPLQRYWQRSRYRHVTELIAGAGAGPRRRLRLEPHHRRTAARQRGG